jgi:adenylate cyclase
MPIQTRQLAAIMFTDIVGYTALMGNDEQKAFELLNKNRQIQKPIIEEYNGRWIKELGDGVMASFSTATDAVQCAISIQQACYIIPGLQLRIGIHLGDVVFENEDVFGDGVNIASRLQAIASPGSIYISEAVQNNISNKKEIITKYVRAETLKNVKEPVRIYEVSSNRADTLHSFNIKNHKPSSKRKKTIFGTAALSLIVIAVVVFYMYKNSFTEKKITGKEKSIAVLPFLNLSSEKDNEYFSDGITSEITNQLSKIGSLDVRAWSSSVQFKNSTKSLKEKAEILNAAAILSGSIQKAGNRIRIQAELTDVTTNKRIWGEEYNREWGDIFNIQSELAQQIALELNARLTKDEKRQLELKPTDNPQAYEYYLQGNQLHEKFRETLNQDFFDISKLMFEKAIQLDSNYALAHAGLATLYNSYTDFIKKDSLIMVLKVKEIEKAYSIAPDLDVVNSTRGAIFRKADKLEESYKSVKKAFEINPNNTSTLFEFGMLYSDLGLVDKRITLLKKAVKLDPLNAGYFGFLGGAEVHVNRLNEGLEHLKTAFRLEPNMFYVVDRIAYVYALQNNLTEASIWLKKFLSLIPPDRGLSFNKDYGQYAAYCYAKLGNKKRALENSKKSRVYLALGMKEEAIKDLLEGDARLKPPASDYLYIQTHLAHKDFDIIRNDPRFLELMEKKRKRYELLKNRFNLSIIEN